MNFFIKGAMLLGLIGALSACASSPRALPPAHQELTDSGSEPANYQIGPLDEIQIFVWQHPELAVNLTVRPDGHISMPLVDDILAAGKTAKELADDIEKVLSETILNPEVSIMTLTYNGTYARQVRVLGEAGSPSALQYRANMTLVDVIIEAGGLTENAAGNRARLVRIENGEPVEYKLKIADLINKGDVSANIRLLPGDIIVIPATIF